MAQLYVNENFPFKVVEVLREMGHDILTSFEAGQANRSIPDRDVLAFATQENKCLLTINRKDFIRLHKAGKKHTGLIVCTQDPDIRGQATRIHQALLKHELLSGKLIRINRPKQE